MEKTKNALVATDEGKRIVVEEFNAFVATDEGKRIVENVVAELFPHLPKTIEKKELPNE